MQEMSPEEARQFLANNRAGILALADGGRAYGVPLFYGYDGRSIYFFTHPGLKMRYIDATREACFTVTRVITLDDWASAQAFGPIRELPAGPERFAATEALMRVPLPPEWGESLFGEPRRGGEGAAIYALELARISGRYSQRPEISEEEKEIALGGM